MSDVKCPKCKKEQEINHDDGYGYEEEKAHSQGCIECNYEFEFTTTISYNYQVYCANDAHVLEPSATHGEVFYCKNCDFVDVELTND